jgi:ParB-like nuclease domain
MLDRDSRVETRIEYWPIGKFVPYARNPRKNDAAVDRMCASIREFGFKIPVLARSNGDVVDGHLRLKAARKLGSWPGGDTDQIPVILCDDWTEGQVKAFRLLVNRSATWADFDEELLALELQDLNEAEFDLSLSGFNPGEIDALLAIPDEERANATPPVPEKSYLSRRRPVAFWSASSRRFLHRPDRMLRISANYPSLPKFPLSWTLGYPQKTPSGSTADRRTACGLVVPGDS